MSLSDQELSSIAAVISAVSANVFLGVSSIFWKQLGFLSAITVVGYRIFLSLIMVVLVLYAIKGLFPLFKILNLRMVVVHTTAAVFLATNWCVFIWASIHGKLLESGLGYLIAPLLTMAVGIVVYREPVGVFKATAMSIILTSIGCILVLNGDLDAAVYLSIGVTWGFYAYIKRLGTLDVICGLLLESAVLSVMYVVYLFMFDFSMVLPAGLGVYQLLLLISCGIVSIVPLALFAFSTKRLAMTSMALLQFFLPVTQFFVAVVIYNQKVSMGLLLAFLAISVGVLLAILEPILKKWSPNSEGIRNDP